MINEDVLIKFSRENKDTLFPDLDWVERAKKINDWIRFVRDWDFKGLGMGDMNLIQSLNVKPGTRIILPGDEVNATILGLVLRRKDTAVELEIEALGCGTDYLRDPDRKLRYGTKIYPDLRDYPFALDVISKAKVSAGPTYYFFSKSIRDNRINRAQDPNIAKRMVLGSLRSNLFGDTRIRVQHLQYLRRIEEEAMYPINELGLPETDILYRIIYALPDENKVKEILNERLEKSTTD